MLKKNIIFGSLIVLTISLYYLFSPSEQTADYSSLDIAHSPTYLSQSMTITVYGPTGMITYKATAHDVSHYPEHDDTYFKKPDMVLYDAKGAASWHLYADNGHLSQKHKLDLTGAVKLTNLITPSQLESITTTDASIDLISQTVTSPNKVTLLGQGFYSTGFKLEGNLRQKTANLLENVQTIYSH